MYVDGVVRIGVAQRHACMYPPPLVGMYVDGQEIVKRRRIGRRDPRGSVYQFYAGGQEIEKRGRWELLGAGGKYEARSPEEEWQAKGGHGRSPIARLTRWVVAFGTMLHTFRLFGTMLHTIRHHATHHQAHFALDVQRD